MRISDWISDVCSSDLDADAARAVAAHVTGEIFNLFADTRLAPVAPRTAWGIVNSFHKVAQQLSRQEDDAARELGELARVLDPSEIHAVKLEEALRLCQSLHEAIAGVEAMRDHAAEVYRVECGRPWPRSDKHKSALQSHMRISNAVFCLQN